jgi:hypothetical protein
MKLRSSSLPIIVVAGLLLQHPLSLISVAEDQPLQLPELIEISSLQKYYLPVIFDHQLHGQSYDCISCHHRPDSDDSAAQNSCSRCHQKDSGPKFAPCASCHQSGNEIDDITYDQNREGHFGIFHIDTPGLKGAYHLQCLGCHREEGAPSKCQDCHGFSKAGRRLFSTTEEPGRKP